MSEEALVPIDQLTVAFYDDELVAVVVDAGEQETVYVPIRPVCDFLGIDWSAQRRRSVEDLVLSQHLRP